MLRRVIVGYVPASGVVLPWRVSVVSGMIAGCDRCAARGSSEDPRDALIREQAQLIAAQAEQIAVLETVVADLREQLETAERAGSRNSGNSSMPPSSDDLPGRKPPRKQRRAAERAEKKKRGKQPGSPGASMTWEVPDRTEDHHPGGACSCGRDLADAADLGVARSYQQEEIPVAAAERVQHDLHESRCACGRVHAAARPAGVPDSALSIGPRLRALAVYLVVFQHVPVERCRQLIADVTGAAVSDGFIHSCLAKAAGLAAEVVRLIRTLITAAAVAGFDETTLRSGPAGEKKYVHGAFTEEYSAFWLGTRSLDSMEDAGILPDFAGIVVSDRYQNYFHPRWEHIAGNQACLSHLLRDYQDCAESYPGAVWPGAGAAGAARHDPCLARRPRAGPGRHPRRCADAAGARVPARRPRRAWPACPASPDRRTARSRSQAASCWNSAATAAATCCCSPRTPACGPRTISASAESGPPARASRAPPCNPRLLLRYDSTPAPRNH